MAAKSGRASIEIVADVSKFAAQLQRDLDKALRGVRLNLSGVSEQIGDGVQAGVDSAKESLGGLDDSAKETLAGVGESAKQAGEEIGDQVGDGAREAADALDEAATSSERSFGRVGDAADDAGAKISQAAEQAKSDLAQTDDQISRVEQSIRELSQEFARTGDQDVFKRLREDRGTLANLKAVRKELVGVAEETDRVRQEFEKTTRETERNSSLLRRGLSATVETAVSLGSAMIGLGASVPTPAGIVALSAVLIGLSAAIPVVIALGAALATLAGLVVVLPASIVALQAVLLPLKVAFSGVGDAIDAILDGDPKKIAEALEKLSPAARSVVKEFSALVPQLKGFKNEVQDAFFTPLAGVITSLVRGLLPSLREGFRKVAGEAGELAKEFAEMLTAPRTIEFINQLFDTMARILDRATPGVQGIFDIFIRLASAGLPLLEDLAGWLIEGAAALADFVAGAEESGKLNTFVSKAVDTFGQLVELIKSIGNFLGALFSQGEAEGKSFLQSLTDGFNAMAEALRSDEGQRFLENMLDLLPLVVQGLVTTVTILGAVGVAVSRYIDFVQMMIGFYSSAGEAGVDAFNTVKDAIVGAFNAVVDFGSGVISWVSELPGKIGGFFSSLGSTIASAFSSAWTAVTDFFSGLIQFFVDLPGQVQELMASFGAFLVEGFRNAFDLALQAVGAAIGLILYSMLILPGQIIDALMALPGLLVAFWTGAWNLVGEITTTAFNTLVAFALALPGRIWGALSSLYGLVTSLVSTTWNAVVSTTVSLLDSAVAFVVSVPGRISSGLSSLYGIVTGAFSRALSAARSTVVDGFNSIVSWIAGVPGRISNLGGRFLSAGRGLMQGFFNGLKQAGGFAGDVGAAVVSAIRSGLNSAIRSINSGIARIDDVLPGSLPRIPMLASGGMTTGPMLAALSEYGQNEVVVPIDDPRTMQALRDALGIGKEGFGPQVLFEAGAISITFDGVVPSREEAYRTGEAVGQGLADSLGRSAVTTAVRTI